MAKITQLAQLDLDGTYSYADYLSWQFEKALELIKGKIMVTIQRMQKMINGTRMPKVGASRRHG